MNDQSWFVGICDGEACVSMKDDNTGRRRLRPRFAVLMEEEKILFEKMQTILGYGRIEYLPAKPRKDGGHNSPHWTFMAESQADLLGVCQFFSAYKLRSRKAEEFLIWKALVTMWIQGLSGSKAALIMTLSLMAVVNRRGGQSQEFRGKIEEWVPNAY